MPDRLRHHGAGPVRGFARRVRQRHGDHPFRHIRLERLDARGPRLVAQKPVEAFLHEALLPAPDAGLRLAGPAHDLVRAEPVGSEQDDLGPPDVLLWSVAVRNQRLKSSTIGP